MTGFILTSIPVPIVYAQVSAFSGAGLTGLPAPGQRVALSPGFEPALLRGLKIHSENPFQFNFIVHPGNSGLKGESFKEESTKLIKYFLTSLTVPEEDLWVNLSPYESNRTIADQFGTTAMGRDLLGQDYLLKQITASLIYPEDDLGREFWAKVYARAQELYGTTDVPMNTFNKVWIVPDKAEIYETSEAVFIVNTHLKVLLEVDYLAIKNNLDNKKFWTDQPAEKDIRELSEVSSSIIKEVILPAIEKEINEGQNFSQLRQIYHAIILAKWYKETLKTSLLSRVYANQNKVNGVDVEDKKVREKIYAQYLAAFKKGVYDYIKEDYDPYVKEYVPRKYFSGGFSATPGRFGVTLTAADSRDARKAIEAVQQEALDVSVQVEPLIDEKRPIPIAPGSPAGVFKYLIETPEEAPTILQIAEALEREPSTMGTDVRALKRLGLVEFLEGGGKGTRIILKEGVRQNPAAILQKLSDMQRRLKTSRPKISEIDLLRPAIQAHLTSPELEQTSPIKDRRDSAVGKIDVKKLGNMDLVKLLKDRWLTDKEIREVIDEYTLRAIPSFERMGQDYYYLSKFIVEKLAGASLPLELEDFTQEAIALGIEAVHLFKSSQTDMMASHYFSHISYGLIKIFQDNTHTVLSLVELQKIFSGMKVIFDDPANLSQNELKLSLSYIIERIQSDHVEVTLLIEDIKRNKSVSVQDYQKESETLGAKDKSERIIEVEQESLLKERIEQVLNTLNAREKEIIKLRFGIKDGYVYALEEVSKMLKITRERVRQIEIRALRKLQSPIRVQMLVSSFMAKGDDVEQINLSQASLLLLAAIKNLQSKKGAYILMLLYDPFGDNVYDYPEVAKILNSFAGEGEEITVTDIKEIEKNTLDILSRSQQNSYVQKLIEGMYEQRRLRLEGRLTPREKIRPPMGIEESPAPEKEIHAARAVRPEGSEFDAEDEILEILTMAGYQSLRFNRVQIKILPYILNGESSEEIARKIKADPAKVEEQKTNVLSTLRFLFTLGFFDKFGTTQEVIDKIIFLTSEKPIERLIRRIHLRELIQAGQNDLEAIIELIMQLYPGEFREKEIRDVVESQFSDITENVKAGKRKEVKAREVLYAVRGFIKNLDQARAQRRKLVLKRLLREQYYPIMAKDYEMNTRQGLDLLQRELNRLTPSADPVWYEVVQATYDYYKDKFDRKGQLRGFRADTESGPQPLLPAQEFGILEAVTALENPGLQSVLHASQARVGKTIMAILSVFNVRNKSGEFDVKSVLYTTKNQAKYEVAIELARRTNQDLDLQVIVFNREGEETLEKQIDRAKALSKQGQNVVVIANYEIVRDFAGDLEGFVKEGAHIIDEVENLKGGGRTLRAPIIFGIQAKYKVGISARFIVNEPEDAAEFLVWTRIGRGRSEEELRKEVDGYNTDEYFSALDPIKVRWRRRVLMPEVPEPIEIKEDIEMSETEEQVVLAIQGEDFVDWKLGNVRPEKATAEDHLFARFEMERQAGVDLGLILIEKELEFTGSDGRREVLSPHQNSLVLAGKKYTRLVGEDGKTFILQPEGRGTPLTISLEIDTISLWINATRYTLRVKNVDLTEHSSKVKRLDKIVESEFENNGKIVGLIDFVEGTERLAARYNRKYGDGTAVAIHSGIPLKKRQEIIWNFRSNPHGPKIILGTTHQLASSLNLFQIPGSHFHISMLVRLTQPWVNLDDAERLIGIGQDHPVRVVTLRSQFRKEAREAAQEEILKTVDERIAEKLREKRQIIAYTLDGRPILDDEAKKSLEAMALKFQSGEEGTALEDEEGTESVESSIVSGSPAGVFKYLIEIPEEAPTISQIAKALKLEPSTLEPDFRALKRLDLIDLSDEGDNTRIILTVDARRQAQAILQVLAELKLARPRVAEIELLRSKVQALLSKKTWPLRLEVVPGGQYNYPDFTSEENLEIYYKALIKKSARYEDTLSYEDFKQGIEELFNFIQENPDYLKEVIAVDPDHHYAVIQGLWEKAHPGQKYMDRKAFDDLVSRLNQEFLKEHPELISALFTDYGYSDFQISTYAHKTDTDVETEAAVIKSQFKPELSSALKWSQNQWEAQAWSNETEQAKALRRQKRIYAYLAIRKKREEAGKKGLITGKEIKGYVDTAEREIFNTKTPAQALAELENISEQKKIEALFAILIYDIPNRQSTLEELYRAVLSYGFSEAVVQSNFGKEQRPVSALTGLDQIVDDRYRELQKAAQLLDANPRLRPTEVIGNPVIPKALSKRLEAIRQKITPLLIKSGESISEGRHVFHLRTMGFEGGYRGHVGDDCTACLSDQAYSVLHPANHYYTIEREGKIYGYVGFTEAVVPGSPDLKFLAVDTIQSPDAVIPSRSIPGILDALDKLARDHGFLGIALPTEESMADSFNHKQVRNAVLGNAQYKQGIPVILESQYATITRRIRERFKVEPSASIGQGAFIIYTKLADPLAKTVQASFLQAVKNVEFTHLPTVLGEDPDGDRFIDRWRLWIKKFFRMAEIIGRELNGPLLTDSVQKELWINLVRDVQKYTNIGDLFIGNILFQYGTRFDGEIKQSITDHFIKRIPLEVLINRLKVAVMGDLLEKYQLLDDPGTDDLFAQFLIKELLPEFDTKISMALADSMKHTDFISEVVDLLSIMEYSDLSDAYPKIFTSELVGEKETVQFLTQVREEILRNQEGMASPKERISAALTFLPKGAVIQFYNEESVLGAKVAIPIPDGEEVDIENLATGRIMRQVIYDSQKKSIKVSDPDHPGKLVSLADLEKRIQSELKDPGAGPGVAEDQTANPGGIDFNPGLIELDKQGEGFNLPAFDFEYIETLPINGFTPVILDITPATNLPVILGTADRQDEWGPT